jgi:hypothetical protein
MDYYDGKMLFSLLLPNDFFLTDNNKIDKDEPLLIIKEGILVQGAIGKSNLSGGSKSLISLFFQEYGDNRCIQFINEVQFLCNHFLLYHGFSIGIDDCKVTRKDEIQKNISKAFLKAKSIEEHTKDNTIKEMYILYALSGARDTGMSIAQKALNPNNSFLTTVISGAKGDYFNIAQITGLLGQQNLNGERIKPILTNNSRTLPHFPIDPNDYNDDMKYESLGFIRSSFIHGLNPREYFFHAMTGREGITDTAMKSVARETTIFLYHNNKIIYTEIGVWIDSLLSQNISKIKTQGDMEILPIKDFSIITTDNFGFVTWENISFITRHDSSEYIYQIQTKSGRSVIVNEGKSLIVYDFESNQLIEMDLQHINIGDLLPITQYVPSPNENNVKTINYEKGFIKGLLYTKNFDMKNKKSSYILDILKLSNIHFSIENDFIYIDDIYKYEINLDLLYFSHNFINGFIDGLFFYKNMIEFYSKQEREIICHLCSKINKICIIQDSFLSIVSQSHFLHLNNVYLDEIVNIKKIPAKEKVYDLTIPKTLNFALANGLQVRDTATSGYIQRRMIKIAEDIQVKYDGTVRNSAGNIIQLAYGDNFLNPTHTIFKNDQALPCNITRIIEKFNYNFEKNNL